MVDATEDGQVGEDAAAAAKPPLETVRLRNGKEEFKPLVASVMLTVRRLFEGTELPDQLALYDLAMAAKDPSYNTTYSRKRLVDLALLERDGRMHDSIRNIVGASLSVEGTTVTMRSPVAP